MLNITQRKKQQPHTVAGRSGRGVMKGTAELYEEGTGLPSVWPEQQNPGCISGPAAARNVFWVVTGIINHFSVFTGLKAG